MVFMLMSLPFFSRDSVLKDKRCFHDRHVIGCSAEGHVSHVYSELLSSRPMGWSEQGSDNMCRLRCFVRNNGKEKIIDLVHYRREKVFQEQHKKATGTDGILIDMNEVRTQRKYINHSGQTRISILISPLSESSCKLLNRRIPNGTYGGVEGERGSPLSDHCKVY